MIEARYIYARVVFKWIATEVIVGVEIPIGQDLNDFYEMLDADLGPLVHIGFQRRDRHTTIAETLEKRIRQRWRGASYFIEIGTDTRWIQVFEPKSHSE